MAEDRFLDRWSRRKREAAAEEAAPAAAAEAEPVRPAEAEPEITPEEIAALPDVASVTAPGDLAVFLRRGVPAALRHAALRRMWVLNPAIRDYVDDAREYAMDWNAPGGVPGGGIVTQAEARALVERFFAARPAPQPVSEAPSDAGSDAAETPDMGSEPSPRVSKTEPDPSPDTPAADAASTVGGPARRRHGGAAPV